MNNSNETTNKEEKSKLIKCIECISIVLILILLIKIFLFNWTIVIGESMFPTLNNRDILIINKTHILVKGYDRGDIVTLKSPDGDGKVYIKRVIGFGGDTVEIINGEVYLNGDLLDEDYIEKDSFTHAYYGVKWEVPEGYAFVLGDNRMAGASKDSRFFDCIPISSLRGVAIYRLFPFDNMGKLE